VHTSFPGHEPCCLSSADSMRGAHSPQCQSLGWPRSPEHSHTTAISRSKPCPDVLLSRRGTPSSCVSCVPRHGVGVTNGGTGPQSDWPTQGHWGGRGKGGPEPAGGDSREAGGAKDGRIHARPIALQ
jgi:hypothetical protein